MFLLGGLATLTELGSALFLRAEGFRAAVPFVALEMALLLAGMTGLLGFALTRERSGVLPAMMGMILALLILWLGGVEHALPCTAPGVAAVLLLIIRERNSGRVPGRAWPAVIVLTLLAFLLLPSGGMPANPLKEQADALRQRVMDLFFFTQPRNVFSLADEGYYPQGSGQMGGPAAPTDHPVMTVTAPRTVYLRGSVRNTYTGRVWRDTTGGRRYLWISPRWRALRASLFDEALPDASLTANTLLTPQTVTVELAAENVSSLFTPQRVRQLAVGGDLVPYFNNASEVFATRDQQAGDTYTVSAPLAVGGDVGLEVLLAACEASAAAPDEAFLSQYTALPAHLQEQLYTLARQAVQNADTPYAKAMALRDWLRASFRYTLDAPWQPEDADFVTYFLLNTGEGCCVHFASAMTVLCRMVGLPARYVEGYLAQPGADGLAHVTGLDAHAWTEVFFPGYGWLTFDATPPQTPVDPEDGAQTPEDPTAPEANDNDSTPPSPSPESAATPTPPPEGDDPAPTPTPTSTEAPAATPTPAPSASPEESDAPGDGDAPDSNTAPELGDTPNLPPWLWIVGALLLLALVAACVALRLHWVSPTRRAEKAGNPTGAWLVWFGALAQALTAMGLGREVHETPAAWLGRLDQIGAVAHPLAPVGESAAVVLYGHVSATEEETAEAEQAYRHVWKAMKPFTRLRILIQRLGRKPMGFF